MTIFISAGLVLTRIHVPSGVASRIASEIGRTIGRSAVRIASGRSWNSVGMPITVMAATARRGS